MPRIRCCLLLGMLVLGAVPVQGEAAVIGEQARQRVREHGEVRVIVALERQEGRVAMHRARQRVLRSLTPGVLRVERVFENAPGFVARVGASGLQQLASHPEVRRVDLDMPGGGGLEESVPQIRADRVGDRGIDGHGVVMAILDTGVDGDHPDLAPVIDAEECFCSADCCPNGTARQSGPASAESEHPHGVHVAGIAVSQGEVAGTGVAPGVRLVAVRVLNDRNRGFVSDWVAGLDWVVTHRPDVRVINMSLVSDAVFAGACDDENANTMMFAELIDLLRGRGAVVFAASGNNGLPDELTAPACVSGAMAVGSVDQEDRVSFFGNSGEALDLLAPGALVVSTAPGGDVAVMSGTSMASPHAAGVAALMLASRPGASAGDIEEQLRNTGVPVRDVRNQMVFPRVDALSAVNGIDAGAERLRGGGSRASDCLLEWNFIPPDIARDGTVPRAVCTDDDPVCDSDSEEGACTFQVSLCFRVPDGRLPECGTGEPIFFFSADWPPDAVCTGDCDRSGDVTVGEITRAVNISLFRESVEACLPADRNGSALVETDELITIVNNSLSGCRIATDLNSLALQDTLPRFPIQTANLCSSPIPVRVEAGLENAANAAFSVATENRRDHDRVRLWCRPREETP